MTTSTERDEHYRQNREFFVEVAREKDGFYDAEKGKRGHSPWQRWVRSAALRLAADVRPPDRISDLGCGMGDFSRIVEARWRGARVTGCDFSPEMLQLTRSGPTESKVGFLAGDLRSLPFQDRAFDLTFCLNTLHHIHELDKPQVFDELARVTGELLVIELKNPNDPYTRFVKRPLRFPHSRASVKEVRAQMMQRGFTPVGARALLWMHWLSPISVLAFRRRGAPSA